MRYLTLFLFMCCSKIVHAQAVTITIDPTQDIKNISPHIYGRNNSIPKEAYAQPLTNAQLTQLKESGVRFLREGGGNNSTKYNWRKRISSHPDWYNNVYSNDWDAAVQYMVNNLSDNVNGMWSFQVIGKVANETNANFNDWAYNSSQWWSGVNQNLAGGGTVNASGGNNATVNGNPNLYLKDWGADSTTAILNHWFDNLSIPQSRVQYWNMDNEPDIWHGTHDDIVNSSLAAETFMQQYFAVAKKARAKYPNIKLVGPVTTNEWQWYNWMNRIPNINGRYYCWLEFFIKRCAEEEAASGIRVLDVVDLHFYPSESTAEQVVQLHRVFFDRNYDYPGANGVKSILGGWDNSQTKEYIFGRINDWLTQYYGQNHGIKLGLTEMDANNDTPSVIATWYASMLGEFMKNEVEIFTPWSWKTGMWETLHLFSRYNFSKSVRGTSSNETLLSAYPSVNTAQDSMTIVLVNRSTTETKSTTVNVLNYNVLSAADTRILSNLPSGETFVSHTQNALQTGQLSFLNNSLTLNVAPLSIVSMTFKIAVTLPVELVNFKAKAHSAQKTVDIVWQVANEQGIKNYALERSTDGKNFDVLTISEAKNTPLSMTYQFEDKKPFRGINYYRLKINELDGKFKYSKLETIDFGEKKPVSIAPNPTSGFVHLNHAEDVTNIEIYDVQGRLIRKIPHQSQGHIDLSDLNKAIYILRVYAKNEVYVFKIVKQ